MTTEPPDREFETDAVPSARPDVFVPVGIHGLMAATQKALAMNRGLATQDHRDGIAFKRIHTTADLMAERVQRDSGQALRKVMGYAARHRSLKGVMPGALNDNVEGHLVGNPLSSPLEEINPLDVLNQAHRVTLMGPGGISSSDMVTTDMQAVHPSEFGFISPIEGPECFDAVSQVYTKRGWTPWPAVMDSDVFACRINGVLEWHPASRIVRSFYKGQMLVGENESIRMCVTPSHRVYCARDKTYRMEAAQEVYGKNIRIPIRHDPEVGDSTLTTFNLPEIDVTNNNQREFEALDLGDWAELLGWWLSEGSHSGRTDKDLRPIRVHQCPEANPVKHKRLRDLLIRLRFISARTKPEANSYTVASKQVAAYFSQWKDGCYDKWIPEECFTWPVAARQRMLEGLLLGDGRWNVKRICYCTVSIGLARSVERLAISLGYPAFIREEKDSRPHVTTTNYVVSMSRAFTRQLKGKSNKHSNGKTYGNYWSKIEYTGFVYCATVPGGMMLVRGKTGTAGFWSGNSEMAGIDSRLANGVKIGSNGRLYQKFEDPHTKDVHWLSPEDLHGKVVGLPEP